MNAELSRIGLGDRVVLNSGGPVMMVVDFEWGRFICAYKIKDEVREANFRSAMLTRVDDC